MHTGPLPAPVITLLSQQDDYCRSPNAQFRFNFTKGAEEHNAENLIILDSLELAKLYLEEAQRLRAQAAGW
jgi:hypothetical protein